MKFKRVSAVVLIVVLLIAGIPHLAFAGRSWSGGGKHAKFTFEDFLKAAAIPIVVLLLPEVVQHYWHYDDAYGVFFTPSEGEGMVMGGRYGSYALLGKDNWVVRPSIGVGALFRIGDPSKYEFMDLMCKAGLLTKFGKKHGFGIGIGLGYAFWYQNSTNLYLTICYPVVG